MNPSSARASAGSGATIPKGPPTEIVERSIGPNVTGYTDQAVSTHVLPDVESPNATLPSPAATSTDQES